jgi:catechol 2,3-dioxygenase-like lactoylglutathione lyase family enzyme
MADQPEFVSVDHISLTVRDMDAAKHFYADLVGLPVLTDVTVDDHASGTPIYDMEHRKRRMVVFERVGGVSLALISHPGDELQGEPIEMLDRVGWTHFAFIVRNLDGFMKRMESLGVPPVAKGFLRDPEGNLIQFEEPGDADRIKQGYDQRFQAESGAAG